jgi:Carboxypeptidase regulatory-like domain
MIGMRKHFELKRPWGTWQPALWIVLLAFVAVALAARDVRAQERSGSRDFDLVGTVVDPAGAPLVGAFVAISGDDWGSLTDEHGRFRLPHMMPGPVSLTAEELGYETLAGRWVAEEGRPLELRMTPKPILLAGLRVVTDRLQRRRLATTVSVQAFGRAALATAPQATMMEFVRSRMGLWTEPCNGIGSICVYSRGRFVEPRVYVDEVPILGGMDYLETYRPSDLYMVEVYAFGREIRAYTNGFMEQAAKTRLQPIALLF